MATQVTDPWLINLKPLRRLPDKNPNVTIFEVPKLLRDKCFQPKMLQLGLLNRTTDCAMQNLKIEVALVLQSKLSGTGVDSWEAFVKAVVEDVKKAKGMFETCTEGMSDEAVQRHLALDALFLVFFFQYLDDFSFIIPDFEIISKKHIASLRSAELTDFLLVENQIPMYLLKNVVKELCKLVPAFPGTVEDELDRILLCAVEHLQPFDPPDGSSMLSRVRDDCCSCIWETENEDRSRFIRRHLKEFHDGTSAHALENHAHILDCVYVVICGYPNPPALNDGYLDNIPSAMELEEIGIEVAHSRKWTVNCVKVNGFCSWIRSSRLELPKLKLYHNCTSIIFRNLAVYEDLVGFRYGGSHYLGDFRCYLECMRDLCRDVKDVQLLNKRGVLDMDMSHEEAVSMWVCCMEDLFTPIPSSGWKTCYDNIQKHRKSGWKRRRRSYSSALCDKPWKPCSVLAAILLLVLTFFQTWFTVVNSSESKWKWPH